VKAPAKKLVVKALRWLLRKVGEEVDHELEAKLAPPGDAPAPR
jgi:hypothetical protein